MKKTIFLTAIFLGTMALSGCWHQEKSSDIPLDLPLSTDQKWQTPEVSPTPTPVTREEEKPSTELTREDLNQNSEYFKIRKELQVNNKKYDTYLRGYERPDCYGFENGLVYSEDLLHMLTDNDKARAVLKPKAYTKEYARGIFEKIQKYNEDILNPPASVFYLCHLSKDVDLIGAKYFLDGKDPNSQFDSIQNNDKEHILFLHSKGELYTLKNIQTLDTTGTGGEVYPCQAKLQNNTILWTCFTGFEHEEESDEVGGPTYRDWTISLDGRILSLKDRKN